MNQISSTECIEKPRYKANGEIYKTWDIKLICAFQFNLPFKLSIFAVGMEYMMALVESN